MGFHETIAADESPRFEAGQLSVSAAKGARFGVFAESGKTFPVYVRFSNGSSRRQSDKEADVRGIALVRPAYRHSVLGRQAAPGPTTVLSS